MAALNPDRFYITNLWGEGSHILYQYLDKDICKPWGLGRACEKLSHSVWNHTTSSFEEETRALLEVTRCNQEDLSVQTLLAVSVADYASPTCWSQPWEELFRKMMLGKNSTAGDICLLWEHFLPRWNTGIPASNNCLLHIPCHNLRSYLAFQTFLEVVQLSVKK